MVAIGGGISKVDTIGKQPVQLSLQYYQNLEYPTGAGRNQLRLFFAFLFPKAKPKPPGQETEKHE
ncbi:MAG: hypothetical protein ACREAA_10505 [Candidatus Polarisedimenticolia bacterium]